MAADIVETSFLVQGLLRGRGGFFDHIGSIESPRSDLLRHDKLLYVGYARRNH